MLEFRQDGLEQNLAQDVLVFQQDPGSAQETQSGLLSTQFQHVNTRY